MVIAKNTILGIPMDNHTRKEVLEKIKKYTSTAAQNNREMFHIVSLNPEIMVSTIEDKLFKEVVMSAQIRIRDGAGVALAGKILGVNPGERLTGVDLMEYLIEYAHQTSRRVLLIGGKGNLAHNLAECYNEKYKSDLYLGIEGYKNIWKPTDEENSKVFSIVADWTPQIVFAAFGSPQSEIWFYNNKDKFRATVCASVGGAFNYLSGNVKRPPEWVRNMGMEWLWRLISEPWRWRRQLKLIEFGILVLKERGLRL